MNNACAELDSVLAVNETLAHFKFVPIRAFYSPSSCPRRLLSGERCLSGGNSCPEFLNPKILKSLNYP